MEGGIAGAPGEGGIHLRNIVIVPLELNNKVLGAIVVAISSRRLMEGDLDFMREFAERAAKIMRHE